MSNFLTWAPITQGIPGSAPIAFSAVTADNLATIITAGYLNDLGSKTKLNDIWFINYSDTSTQPLGEASTVGMFKVVVAGPNTSLVLTSATSASGGSFTIGDLIKAGSTAGDFLDSGISFLSNILNVPGSGIFSGNVQAGLSGSAGTLSSFSSTGSRGSLVIAGVANTGNTNVTVSNSPHGQASLYSIADIGGATGNLVVSKTASRVWVGVVSFSGGTAGPVAITATGMPAAIAGSFTIKTSANAVTVQKQDLSVAAQVTVLFSGDPGAGTANVIAYY